jgi:hypothetical protein
MAKFFHQISDSLAGSLNFGQKAGRSTQEHELTPNRPLVRFVVISWIVPTA